MGLFDRKQPQQQAVPEREVRLTHREARLKKRHREPGHAIEPEAVFEVWGDMLDCTYLDTDTLHDLAWRAVDHMATMISNLLGHPNDQEAMVWCSDPKGAPYLLIKWENLQGEIGARPFGRCLDMFGVLILPRGFAADPNPLVRLAKLSASDRRNIELFQSLLKYVLEQTIEALDENRLV